MINEFSVFRSIDKINDSTHLIKVYSPSIAASAKPGQFCNIKVSDNNFPLLRRPFSICDVNGDEIHFLFDIHGEGTRLLCNKKNGDTLDILGPLGSGFKIEGDYDTAVIVAGGLGSAPFPFLIKKLPANKKIVSFVGGRSKDLVLTYGLKNVFTATDDGSDGFNGTVVELLKMELENFSKNKIRIFSCGPNPMLKALQLFSIQNNYDCQLSLESAMACGFGICQGCPVESADGESYLLVCKDGPIFNADQVKL